MSLMDPAAPASNPETTQPGDRLDSWKEIARYLNRSVRTLYRWEKEEGLPVHRHQHRELGSVFAYKGELDAWLNARRPDAGLAAEGRQAAPLRRSARVVALALATAAVLIGSTLYLSRGRSHREGDQGSAHVAALELVSSFSGSHRWPALSPDGRVLAFVSDAGGTPQVWVKNLGGGDPVQITFGDRPAVRPRWAAHGDRIVFSIRGGGIWSVAALGGDLRRIVEQGWNADLSPDGERLVFERGSQLWAAKADGTGVTSLSGLPQAATPHYGDAFPTFSPDGLSIAAFLGEEGRYGDYWVIPSQGGKARRLTTDFAEGGAPAWTPDGNFLVFPSARAGSANRTAAPCCSRTSSAHGRWWSRTPRPEGARRFSRNGPTWPSRGIRRMAAASRSSGRTRRATRTCS
jgi:dipeptidyl aminopeptidase/acylaminoacyl peptidase